MHVLPVVSLVAPWVLRRQVQGTQEVVRLVRVAGMSWFLAGETVLGRSTSGGSLQPRDLIKYHVWTGGSGRNFDGLKGRDVELDAIAIYKGPTGG